MPKQKQARWQKQVHYDGDNPGHDKVFDRVRSLSAPGARETLPIFLEDDLPKDLFFPIDKNDIAGTFQGDASQGITHIWLRRPKSSEFRSGRIPFAEYVRTEKICLIALYPWPRNMLIPLQGKPGDAILKRYKIWSPELISHKSKWQLKWSPDTVRPFYVDELLKAELIHHAEVEAKIVSGAIRSGVYARQRFFENTLALR
jgi:hypothetical protein